jgi:hypothetical protein
MNELKIKEFKIGRGKFCGKVKTGTKRSEKAVT